MRIGSAPAPASATIAKGLVAALLAVLFGATIFQRSLWYDELATYTFANLPWHDLWRALHKSDAFYGFYYAFMHVWIRIFGGSEASLRAPSVLAALGCVALAVPFARRERSRVLTWVTGSVLATTLIFVHYAGEARPYALLMLVTLVLSHVALRDVPPSRAAAKWTSYAGLAVIGVYLHLYVAFAVVAHVAYVGVYGKRREFAGILCASLAAALCCVPLLHLIAHDVNSQNLWLDRLTPRTFVGMLKAFSGGSRRLATAALVLAVIGAVTGTRGRFKQTARFALFGFFVPLLCLLLIGRFRPDYKAPYLLEVLPSYAVLVSLGLASFARVRTALLATAVFVALQFLALVNPPSSMDQDWRGAFAATARDRLPIVFWPPVGIAALRYYAPDQAARVVYPRYFAIEDGADFERLAGNDLPIELAPAHQEFWVVFDSFDDPDDPTLFVGNPKLLERLRAEFQLTGTLRLTGLTLERFRIAHEADRARRASLIFPGVSATTSPRIDIRR